MPGDLGNPARDQIDERPRLGQKHVGVRELELQPPAHLFSRCLAASRLDEMFERFLRVAIVEADIESRARLPGDQVHGSIADVDRGELQVRRSEMLGAFIERLRHQRAHQRDEPADRIVRKLRGGDMPLPAGHGQRAVERAAPADLEGVAQSGSARRLADEGMIEHDAALGCPAQQLDRAVDRHAFLIAGDEQRNRAARPAGSGADVIDRSSEEAGDGALHVDRAASEQLAVGDLARERRMRPGGFLARRHHVGVTGEGEMFFPFADARVEIGDIRGSRLRECRHLHREAGGSQQASQHVQRPAVRRRHRPAADQVPRDRNRVGAHRRAPNPAAAR